MLNFNSILLFSEDPKSLAEFYKKVFDKEPEWNEGGYMGFQVGSGFVTIGPHDKVHGKNQNPERIIINYETTDVKGEFERIKGLGAKVIAEPYNPGEEQEMMLATLEDPDGNFFQLASPFTM
jgi:predicted enzyme related to lactoylglutathione lyase